MVIGFFTGVPGDGIRSGWAHHDVVVFVGEYFDVWADDAFEGVEDDGVRCGFKIDGVS